MSHSFHNRRIARREHGNFSGGDEADRESFAGLDAQSLRCAVRSALGDARRTRACGEAAWADPDHVRSVMQSENHTPPAKPFSFSEETGEQRRSHIPRIAVRRGEPRVGKMLEALPPRVRDIAIMRGLGYSLAEIARHMDLTPQAVSILLQRHRTKIRELGVRTEHWTLSTRAANVLGRLRISTREEARAKNVAGKLRGQRNCGKKTIREIERWQAEETKG